MKMLIAAALALTISGGAYAQNNAHRTVKVVKTTTVVRHRHTEMKSDHHGTTVVHRKVVRHRTVIRHHGMRHHGHHVVRRVTTTKTVVNHH